MTVILELTIYFILKIYFYMGHARPLFRFASVFFKLTLQFLQQNNVTKCPSSIEPTKLQWIFDKQLRHSFLLSH